MRRIPYFLFEEGVAGVPHEHYELRIRYRTVLVQVHAVEQILFLLCT